MWKDFKEFAFKGNVLDLAVAVVIGAAFGKIVSSLVENIITPLIGILVGGVNFKGLSVMVGDAEVTYGVFLQNVFDFLIIAFSIFMILRGLMKLKRQKEEEVVEETEEELTVQEELLREIRDLLKEQKN
ncbi:large conductance mechanosensitive channel [Bhargavaea ginsengi]|uniref:Large-conductance mechanosensitive channel n=1 Tax=Bhargavaea ginsengi TaxID=426757 RepID=A0A1H6ZQY4_9BACL|nr:large conductance mechanosensitive channel protein MscL [Bhargavaea ginsengi]MCM3088570.1 large conductance mechanosensitive channel protein MscL [Bhargavaea ginsengi]SEJ52142.1 large conductance mechanosensitive channel [Bhargavaea ginsengi]